MLRVPGKHGTVLPRHRAFAVEFDHMADVPKSPAQNGQCEARGQGRCRMVRAPGGGALALLGCHTTAICGCNGVTVPPPPAPPPPIFEGCLPSGGLQRPPCSPVSRRIDTASVLLSGGPDPVPSLCSLALASLPPARLTGAYQWHNARLPTTIAPPPPPPSRPSPLHWDGVIS